MPVKGMTIGSAREAKKAGKVWVKISHAGGKDTPVLGACSIKSTGALDWEKSFYIHMLACGHSFASATKELRKAKRKLNGK